MVDQVTIVVRELRGGVQRVVRDLAVNITAELIERTPVDTGWARANWIPTIGASDNTPATGNPTTAIVPAQRNRQEASTAALATGYRLERGAVFISNNVPYILRLNDGSSKQAPSGFVQASIRRELARAARRRLQ